MQGSYYSHAFVEESRYSKVHYQPVESGGKSLSPRRPSGFTASPFGNRKIWICAEWKHERRRRGLNHVHTEENVEARLDFPNICYQVPSASTRTAEMPIKEATDDPHFPAAAQKDGAKCKVSALARIRAFSFLNDEQGRGGPLLLSASTVAVDIFVSTRKRKTSGMIIICRIWSRVSSPLGYGMQSSRNVYGSRATYQSNFKVLLNPPSRIWGSKALAHSHPRQKYIS